MFVACYIKYKIQFILETHSEYLIRKIQYLIGKKEFDNKDVNLYYFYPPDKVPKGEPQVKRIDIEKDGRLTDEFGSGFFDEADNLAIDLFQLSKSQKN